MTDIRRTDTLLATGQSLLREGRFAEAAEVFRDILARQPASFPSLTGLALVLEAGGRSADALQPILGAARAEPRDVHTKRRFLRILAGAGAGHFDSEVLDELLRAMRIPSLTESACELASIPLGRKYAGGPDRFRGRSVERLIHEDLRDPLLLEFLARGRNRDLGLEQLLIRIRRELLLGVDSLPYTAPLAAFAHCLAHHCINNGYVFPLSAEEEVLLGKIDGEIAREARAGVSPRLEWLLALYACFRPVVEASAAETVRALPAETLRPGPRGLVKRTLIDALEEARLKPQLPGFGKITDQVSVKVRAQYEEFPYPQWMHIRVVDDYPTRLRLIDDDIDWPAVVATGPEVLVAGCGTGRHPITIAANNPAARVAAIDLSSASLAYGWRMASELGITNVEFHLGDLLQVELLGRRFHLIECVGVLHHLDDPLEGLGALASVLHPQGLLRIGLYSATARRPITRARELIARLGLNGSAEDVRNLRAQIASGTYPELAEVTRFEDYFGLPSCKDLLFHAHEVQFDVPGIRALLEHHSLEFLGMDCTDEIQAEVRRLDAAGRLPRAAHRATLEYWEAAEAAQPWLFGSMYVFWCGRKGESQRRR